MRGPSGSASTARPARSNGDLFSTYVTAAGHPEELELVVGVGCLAWTPAGHPSRPSTPPDRTGKPPIR